MSDEDLGREDEAEMHERSAWRSRALALSVPPHRVAVHGSASSRGFSVSLVRFCAVSFWKDPTRGNSAGLLVSFEVYQLRLLVYQFGPGGVKNV